MLCEVRFHAIAQSAVSSPKGAKTELIQAAIEEMTAPFTLSELLLSKCPGVSRDMIHNVLKDKKMRDEVSCSGRGPAARWEKR
jgi:hypothetical protein